MNIPLQSVLNSFEPATNDDRERLRFILMGSGEWITQTIRQLHSLGFADVGDWSPLTPTPQGELMSILTRHRAR
ncbi:hypothetical protein [Leptolyngbya sp. NIES-2104]|uniref:hypothetical protein n=1 Tax=Leptolyngbya sp. NIES-2104 TaxID=1552121 RepID=UPI0006ECAF7B|nr:hypothetical protein [Leptolyngbya sp. NIES-2104]GAP94920.1 hypothetical protein NIES2104_14380 [Leptolyngbya sp. NIES-2104]